MSFTRYKGAKTSSAGDPFGKKGNHHSLPGIGLWLYAGLAVSQGLALIAWGSKGAVVTLGAGYFYALFRWPHLTLIAGLVFIFDGLGFINPNTFFRTPGVFKLKDLIFLSLFLPLLMNIKWQKRATQIFHDCRTLLFPILVILVLTTLQMVRTSLQYDLPLNTCIMAGRHYLYYAFVPLAAIYLDTSYKREIVFRIFMVVIAGLACVVIIQTVIYAVFKIRLVSYHIQFGEAYWGKMQLFSRIYLEGEPILVLGFALAFWGLFRRRSTREMLGYAAMATLFALALLFINSRMRWFHTLLVVLIPVFLLWRHIPNLARRLLCVLALLLFTLVSVFVLSGSRSDLVSGIGARAFSAWTDFREKEGTWEYRLEDNRFRLKLIRKHPLFGVGFIHLYFAERFGAEVSKDPDFLHGITSTDSGIVDLLVHFGAIGGLWASWYFVSVLCFCSKMLKAQNNESLHWTSIPLIAYMTGGVITLVTLGLFTMVGEIVGHSFVLGILASDQDIQPQLEH